MYKTGDKKNVYRFGNNYKRLHITTMSDIEVAADILVQKTMEYVNTTNHVPARWQRRLAEPVIADAKRIRAQIIDANQIRVDAEDRAILKSNYSARIRGWSQALRLAAIYERGLNDILNICAGTSEDNMKQVSDALGEVLDQAKKLRKSDIEAYSKL